MLFLIKKHKINIILGTVLVLISIIGIVAVYIFHQKPLPPKPIIPAQFQLRPLFSDTAGIELEKGLILESIQPLSEEAVKKILKFDPEIDFVVKKINPQPEINPQPKTPSFKFKIEVTEPVEENKIYQATITDRHYAIKEYSWAFQTKASFQIIQTHPRNKATSVPINSGIEIVFNRENLINPESYFEITPDTKGSFEQYGNTLTFLPQQLIEKMVYTITIKKGLKSEGSEDILKEDYIFTFETREKEYVPGKPYFNFQSNFLEFIPDKKPVFEIFFYGNLDPQALEMNIYKFNDISEFLNSYQESRNWNWGWTKFHKEESNYKPKDEQKILSFKPTIIKEGYQKFIELPQPLETGYYLLDVDVQGKRIQAWLQITPLAHYFSITYDKSFLWVYDFIKKQPLINSKTSFYKKTTEEIDLGFTNQEGLIELFTPQILKDKNNFEPKFFKLEQNDYLPYLVRITPSWDSYYEDFRYREIDKGDFYWDYLSTDRYTYQMNDTIRYWGVIKGRQEDLRQKKVKVGLYSSGSYFRRTMEELPEPLIFEEVLISQFDTIQGELSFKGISPDWYLIVVSIGEEIITTTDVEILTYTKPLYQIVVTPSKKAIFAGEEVDFKVKASFFDGTPVSNLKLRYYGYWCGEINGELDLDENGEGALSYTPKYYEYCRGWRRDYPSSLSFAFYPQKAEEEEISGRGNILVFGPNIHLQLFKERLDNNNFKLTAKLNHIVIKDLIGEESSYRRNEYIGEPASNHSLSAEIIKITYFKVETGQCYDPINKIVRKTYRYERKKETIDKLSGTTDRNGEWSFIKNFPEEKESIYEIIFFGKDNKERRFEDSITAYHFPEHWKKFAISLNLEGGKGERWEENQFSIGEKIRLELKISEGEKPSDSKILFYRYKNNIEKIFIKNDFILEEIFEKDFQPSVQYRAVILGPYGFEESNDVIASFKEKDSELTIDINPDKEKYQPGEKVKIDLIVKDKDNKPILAEINIAVVDEALFHILPYDWHQQRNILESFYENIYISPLTNATQYAFLEKKGNRGGCFGKGTPILMADGSSKPIEEVKIGDQILTFSDENKSIIAPAIVQGIFQHLVDEYLIINNSLKVTPEHKIYVNERWELASNIKIGDKLKGIDGSSRKVYSVEREREKNTLVYNIIVSKYHSYFAEGYFVHNDKGKARTNFVDTAFYQTVRTDKHGKAEISFILPDNITSWRVSAIAFSPEELKVGQNIKLIKTSLPFFVEATLSNYYLLKDNPILRLRVFGTDYKQNETTEFKIESTSLKLDRKESSKNNIVHFPLTLISEGEHEITISAKQGILEDSLKRKIKAVKSYFRKLESSIYTLTDNLSEIEGNKDGFTKLIFIDKDRGRFYQSLLWRYLFLDGIRSDQIIANFFGKKLLAQYFKEPVSAEILDLSNYHTEEGGISLFPYSDTDLELSAKIVDLAPEFVFQKELKNYFYRALRDKKSDIHRIAKALYGLASLKEPILVKINLLKDNKELNLEDKIYLALALTKLGDKETAYQIYHQEIRTHLRFQGKEAWLYKKMDLTRRVKLTAIIAILSSYLNIETDSDSLWNYINTHNPERDLDVLEETLFIKSELAQSKEEKVSFSYKTNKRSDSVILEKGKIYTLIIPPEELQTIKFFNIKGKINLISFYEKSREPEELIKNDELKITREYLVNNKSTNSFKEGDVILIRLDPNIATSAISGSYQVIDYLPSGLRPITRIYEQRLSYGSECDPVWYPIKIIDNAVYFEIDKDFDRAWSCKNRTLNYYARVISKGNYQVNPAIIQSLKDLNSLNISSEDNVKIE